MKHIVLIIKIIFIIVLFSNCAGTIKTLNYSEVGSETYKKAYIVSAKSSDYIKFKFGTFTYNGYMVPVDDASVESEVIGNTAEVIKEELGKYGIEGTIGEKGDQPEGYDLIVKYTDTWRWDFKKVLDKLEIIFVSAEGDSILAKSTYDIYHNKELHNFPSPEKEVPKMMKQLLKK